MVYSNFIDTMLRIKGYLSRRPSETIEIGRKIARRLRPGDVVFLAGELGSGKTTFTKGICLGLGIKELVTSSSFVIVSEYKGKFKVNHIDLYRLNERDLSSLPIEEYYTKDGITIIEWADRLPDFSRRNTPGIYVSFLVKGKDTREIRIEDIRN